MAPSPVLITECNSFDQYQIITKDCKTDSFFNILYCNARSIANVSKFHLFKLLVNKVNPDCVILTETWLKPGDEVFYSIDGFELSSAPRIQGRGGGVAVYLRSSVRASIVTKIQSDHSILHLECKLSQSTSTTHVIAVYNPRIGVSHKTLGDLEEIISGIKGKVILIGDFNINLLSPTTLCRFYMDYMASYDLSIVNNTLPTRGENLIDHVWTNDPSLPNWRYYSVIDAFADHRWSVVHVPAQRAHIISQPVVKNLTSYIKVKNYLEASPFVCDPRTNNLPEDIVCYLKKAISNATSEVVIGNGHKLKSLPWVTDHYLMLHNRKHNWYILCGRYPNNREIKESYRSCASKERNLRKLLLKRYFNSKIKSASGNSRNIWRALNELSGRASPGAPDRVDKLITQTGLITDVKAVANEFNDFFIRVGDSDTLSLDLNPIEPIHRLFSSFEEVNVENMFK